MHDFEMRGIMTQYQTAYDDMYKRYPWQIVNGGALKLTAMLIMLLDHIGAAILRYLPSLITIPEERYQLWHMSYRIVRNIGRSAFPIFCFFIVEGFYHTHNKAKYAARLLLFAMLSQYPFELAVYGEYHWKHTNVFFTLFLGLLTIWSMSETDRRIRNAAAALTIKAFYLSAGCLTAYVLNTDYDYKGVLLIVILYLFRPTPALRSIAGYLSFLWEPYCLPGFLMLHLYNGERGKPGKYLFYSFYPLHLLILYLLRIYVIGNIGT